MVDVIRLVKLDIDRRLKEEIGALVHSISETLESNIVMNKLRGGQQTFIGV